jgi:hypothetical protein
MKPFTVLNGRRDEATFVCTWCAARFLSRTELEEHWKASKKCFRQRNVSNQTQSKYRDVSAKPPMPGQPTLDRVESFRSLADLAHTTNDQLHPLNDDDND